MLAQSTVLQRKLREDEMRILLLLLPALILLTSLEVVDGYKHACEVITNMERNVEALKTSIRKIEKTQEAAMKIVKSTSRTIKGKRKAIEAQYQAIRDQRAGIERRSRRRRSGRNRNKRLCDD